VGAALRRRDLEVGAAADQGAGSGVAVAAAGSALGRQGATTSDVGRKKRGGWGWMDCRGERLEFHVYIYVCVMRCLLSGRQKSGRASGRYYGPDWRPRHYQPIVPGQP
jgi:hypothetical protein